MIYRPMLSISALICLPIFANVFNLNDVYAQTATEIPEIKGIVEPHADATNTSGEHVETLKQEQQSQKQDDSKEKSKAKKKRRSVSEMDHFMRVRRNGKRKPVAFETSVTRYVLINESGDPVYVDLIGVVHIGELSYYKKLNEIFEDYDSVLYELVAPEGTVIPKGGGRDRSSGMNPIAALQVGMQTVLGLEFQLEHVDYEKDNFVHADMSPEEFMESMRNNDESFTKMFFKAVGQSMAQSGNSSMNNFDLLRVAFAKDKEIKMRELFASQMMEMEGGMAMFEGREGSTIINHRNGKAMEILDQEIAAGKKKLAIFYGAGHLPDMQKRLTSDFQMKRAGQYWLEAWKLKR